MNRKISEMVSQYNNLRKLFDNAAIDVQGQITYQMQEIRKKIWNLFAESENNSTIIFNSASDLSSVINILLDSGKIFGIGWVRRTTSKSNPNKTAGSVDVLTVKKVHGYVKGTMGGKKAMDDILAGRVTLWVANGELQRDGYGNWRSIYAIDVKSIHINGVVNIEIQ